LDRWRWGSPGYERAVRWAGNSLYGLAVVAAFGFVASLLVHLGTWLRIAPPSAAWVLQVGIFIVWLPAIFAFQRLTKDFKQKESWAAALRGAPLWVPTALKSLTGYGLLNFAFFMFETTRSSSSVDRVVELGSLLRTG
jgi:hypothetical protein